MTLIWAPLLSSSPHRFFIPIYLNFGYPPSKCTCFLISFEGSAFDLCLLQEEKSGSFVPHHPSPSENLTPTSLLKSPFHPWCLTQLWAQDSGPVNQLGRVNQLGLRVKLSEKRHSSPGISLEGGSWPVRLCQSNGQAPDPASFFHPPYSLQQRSLYTSELTCKTETDSQA